MRRPIEPLTRSRPSEAENGADMSESRSGRSDGPHNSLLTAGPAAFAVAVALSVLLLWRIDGPLGIVGEWTWNRSPHLPNLSQWFLPLLASFAYAGALIGGLRLLERFAGQFWCEAGLLVALLPAGALWQAVAVDLPISPAGIERWPFALAHPATSGYFSHARQMQDVHAFIKGYDAWIADQDSFHIGTHPPGLFLVSRVVLEWFKDRPDATRTVLAWTPARFQIGLVEAQQQFRLTPAERAGLVALAGLTMLAGLSTLIPIYGLLRLYAAAQSAWLGAGLWPLSPGLMLFLPLSDCLYPVLAATVIFLLGWSLRVRLAFPAVLAGGLLCTGLMLTLAFLGLVPLALGLIALVERGEKRVGMMRRCVTLAAFVAGAALIVEWAWHAHALNLPIVWSINLDKHAGFYTLWPRSYWPWVVINLLEFVVVCGPTIAAAAVGSWLTHPTWPWRDDLAALSATWLAALLALDLSGRNLGEVGRLWLFLTPFAFVAIARILEQRRLSSALVAVWGLAQAISTLTMVACVEPLLPISLAAVSTR